MCRPLVIKECFPGDYKGQNRSKVRSKSIKKSRDKICQNRTSNMVDNIPGKGQTLADTYGETCLGQFGVIVCSFLFPRLLLLVVCKKSRKNV